MITSQINTDQKGMIEELVNEFVKSYEEKIIQMILTFQIENGPGVLFIDLIPENMEELDIEFYKLEDLDPKLRTHIVDNPKRMNSIYYIINLKNMSFLFEKDLIVFYASKNLALRARRAKHPETDVSLLGHIKIPRKKIEKYIGN